MNSVVDKLKIILITTLLLMATTAGLVPPEVAEASVDVLFQPASTTVERNNFLTIGIIASADAAAEIDLIDANFYFDNAAFFDADINSSIAGWPESKEEVEQENGYILYQKSAKGKPELYHFDVGAGATRNIYSVTFKVTSVDAKEGLTTLDFEYQGFLNILEKDVSILGTFNQAQITILPDTTPPETSASHASGYYNSAINVSLFATDPYDDLDRIKYDKNGNTPNVDHSPNFYPGTTAPIDMPENAVTTLKFYGVDEDENTENVNVRTYTVDTIAPIVTNLVVSPSFARAGQVITINFELSENLTGVLDNVSVNIGSFAAMAMDDSYPTYEYYYVITGGEPEGVNDLVIKASDAAGNISPNITEQVTFDFIPPAYSGPFISASGPNQLFIHFNASEALDTANTVVSIDGMSWAYESNTDLEYVYSYTLTGTETTRLVEVHGYDLAGNDSWNTEDWDLLTVSGEDLYGNAGSKSVTIDIRYEP